VWKARSSASHAPTVRVSRDSSGHTDAVCPVVEARQRPPGIGGAVGGIDGPEQLLALPARGDLTGRIPSRQAGPQPRPPVFGELLGGGDEQLADTVQRVVLATSMPECGLLGPMADLVDHDVGQPDGVEVVHHHGGVGKRDDQRACLAAPRIQRDHGPSGQPVWRPGPEPAVHRWEIAHPGRPAAVGFAGTPQPA
jgi:hypothetical protein